MKSAPEPIPCKCYRPAVGTMDFHKGIRSDGPFRINRICNECGKHWYGKLGRVWEFTKQQWDNAMNRPWNRGSTNDDNPTT